MVDMPKQNIYAFVSQAIYNINMQIYGCKCVSLAIF